MNIWQNSSPCVQSDVLSQPQCLLKFNNILVMSLKIASLCISVLLLSFIIFACLTEQNSKLVDLKLKKLLEAQPQVANSLSSDAQKAATDTSEQGVKVNLTNLTAVSSASPQRNCCFIYLKQFKGIQKLFLNSDFAKRNIAKRILSWFSA